MRFAIGFLPSRELGRVLDDYYNHLLALEIGPEHAEAAKRALALDDEIAELLTNT
ncbi:hypothetical protein [Rhodococcus sp. NPDC049939]|uniref:hypothetical protein n=1 Tax=Rhodococcus sp. NPDC049939 TaxID=3155511 RepID=UPI0034070D86